MRLLCLVVIGAVVRRLLRLLLRGQHGGLRLHRRGEAVDALRLLRLGGRERRLPAQLVDKLELALQALFHAVQELRRGGLGRIEALLLLADEGVDIVRLGAGGILCLMQHLRALFLGVRDHLVARLLRGKQGVLHGSLLLAVFLQLFHKNAHLALQHGIFFIEGNIVLGQRLENVIDGVHIVSAEQRLLKADVLNLLRGQHRLQLLSLSCVGWNAP